MPVRFKKYIQTLIDKLELVYWLELIYTYIYIYEEIKIKYSSAYIRSHIMIYVYLFYGKVK